MDVARHVAVWRRDHLQWGDEMCVYGGIKVQVVYVYEFMNVIRRGHLQMAIKV